MVGHLLFDAGRVGREAGVSVGAGPSVAGGVGEPLRVGEVQHEASAHTGSGGALVWFADAGGRRRVTGTERQFAVLRLAGAPGARPGSGRSTSWTMEAFDSVDQDGVPARFIRYPLGFQTAARAG
ncbi:hypothetical protein SAZ_05500 [Streptomyces noursei ZPM]|nr:hypothetical protein SAZ_05500 [Streptomyces noursei ZPM]EOT03531.2 hypothetical protein K530_13219 [Streptomyces noursei CCRC 11814]EXU92900.1 hypothetical protein P354_00240 [Streptomyces noursei PD-1]